MTTIPNWWRCPAGHRLAIRRRWLDANGELRVEFHPCSLCIVVPDTVPEWLRFDPRLRG